MGSSVTETPNCQRLANHCLCPLEVELSSRKQTNMLEALTLETLASRLSSLTASTPTSATPNTKVISSQLTRTWNLVLDMRTDQWSPSETPRLADSPWDPCLSSIQDSQRAHLTQQQIRGHFPMLNTDLQAQESLMGNDSFTPQKSWTLILMHLLKRRRRRECDLLLLEDLVSSRNSRISRLRSTNNSTTCTSLEEEWHTPNEQGGRINEEIFSLSFSLPKLSLCLRLPYESFRNKISSCVWRACSSTCDEGEDIHKRPNCCSLCTLLVLCSSSEE